MEIDDSNVHIFICISMVTQLLIIYPPTWESKSARRPPRSSGRRDPSKLNNVEQLQMTSHSRQLLLSYNLPRNGFLTSTRAFKRYQPVKHNKLQMMKMSFRPLMLLYLFYLEIRGSLVTLAYTSGKRLWRLLGRDGAGATKFQQLFHLTSMMLRPLQRP